MSDEIKPAMTPEEWANVTRKYPQTHEPPFNRWTHGGHIPEDDHEALAYLNWLLRDTGKGFDDEDVAILIDVLAFIHGMDSACDETVRSLANRIRALLPPSAEIHK